MDKISSVLDAEIDVADRPGRAPARPDRRPRSSSTDVTFAYGDEPVLHEIDDLASAGRLHRARRRVGRRQVDDREADRALLRPDEGAVRVDGTDLRDVQLRRYRRQLGVVLQDPFLFSGTIADNIRFAKPDATDEEVRRRAAAVGVDRVAARLEDGLDHVVREGGAGLSAGERQLISIARALLADPRILILDEATSNIDRPTEILIERAFDTLLPGGRRSSSPTGSRPSGAPTRSSCSSMRTDRPARYRARADEPGRICSAASPIKLVDDSLPASRKRRRQRKPLCLDLLEVRELGAAAHHPGRWSPTTKCSATLPGHRRQESCT